MDPLRFFNIDDDATEPSRPLPLPRVKVKDAPSEFAVLDFDSKMGWFSADTESDNKRPHSNRKKYMQGLHGSGAQHRSAEWATAMRACRDPKHVKTEDLRGKAKALDESFNETAVQYRMKNKVQNTLNLIDDTANKRREHGNWISPDGGVVLAKYISAFNMNFQMTASVTKLHKVTVRNNVQRVGYIILRIMMSVVTSAMDALGCQRPQSPRTWFSSERDPRSVSGSIFCESFMFDEAEQVVRPRHGHATQASVMSMDGAFLLFNGVQTTLLNRSLHPSCVLSGTITAEATLALARVYSIASIFV